jgi:dTDP-4-dehydrorhamnose 3,5-epimerase
MIIKNTQLEGVLIISPEPSAAAKEYFSDERGSFLEEYNEQKFKKNGIDVRFIEDDISLSKKDVLRGIHVSFNTWKLISCLKGKAFYVVVNCLKESKNFGKWESFELSDSNHYSILVPPMYGSSYFAVTDIMIHYKQSAYYNPTDQFTYRWDEPKFGIKWPANKPILSPRDASAEFIK